MNSWGIRAGLLAGALVCATPAAMAATTLSIGMNEYFHFAAHGVVSRIAVGNPEVADVTLLADDTEFLIVGKKAGTTTLLVWYENGLLEEYVIGVSLDDAGQSYIIQQAIGLPHVRVRVIMSGEHPRILLEGTVKDQVEHDRAVKIASLYSGDAETTQTTYGNDDGGFEYDLAYRSARTYANVVDLLQIQNPTQIRLETQIIEVSYNKDDTYGTLFNSATAKTMDTDTGFTTVTAGAAGAFYGGEDFGGLHNTGFWLLDHFSRVNATINLLLKDGKARVLSRPNISTLSGAKAKIHIGGSLPFPKDSGNSSTTFEWKDYGIRLNIIPVMESDHKITAEVHAEVSAPDYTRTIQTSAGTVPSMRSRNVHSLVHMDEGYTMIIGGLLSSEDAKSVQKIPLLSSIPIIGEFFKHTSKTNEKRELIILVTPRVVDGDTPAEMSDKMREWYAQNEYEARNRNQVDVNNPPLPEKEAKKEEERDLERKTPDRTTPEARAAEQREEVSAARIAEEAAGFGIVDTSPSQPIQPGSYQRFNDVATP